MNVLSLFDGMSCGQIALQKLGIKYDNYYASEIDKFAMQIAKKNFPDTIHIGDVTQVRSGDLPKIDLLIGGSPCQGFSFAGKGLNFDDPRSKLFFEFVRLKKELNPKYFLLENVKMKKDSMDVISEFMGTQPIEINSALVSAQSRKRLYWTNIPFNPLIPDKGILLKDIIQHDHNEAAVKKTERNARHLREIDEKALCCSASMWKGAGNNGMTLVRDLGCKQVATASINDSQCNQRVYSVDGKCPTLRTMQGGNQEPKILELMDDVIKPTEKQLAKLKTYKYKDQSKTGTILSAHHKRGVAPEYLKAVRRKSDITNKGKSIEDYTWRKLTPLECERLQTVPDGYTEGVSNTQRYKMLGNGWTVDVIAHIFEGMIL